MGLHFWLLLWSRFLCHWVPSWILTRDFLLWRFPHQSLTLIIRLFNSAYFWWLSSWMLFWPLLLLLFFAVVSCILRFRICGPCANLRFTAVLVQFFMASGTWFWMRSWICFWILLGSLELLSVLWARGASVIEFFQVLKRLWASLLCWFFTKTLWFVVVSSFTNLLRCTYIVVDFCFTLLSSQLLLKREILLYAQRLFLVL